MMATQVLGQSGGSSLFPGSSNLGMALSNDVYDFAELSKAELAAPQLIMLANVALTGEVNGNCCDYTVGEEKQMAELTTVGNTNFSDSEEEDMDDVQDAESDREGLEDMALAAPEAPVTEAAVVTESSGPPPSPGKDTSPKATDAPETADDKCKSSKNKPFRCKPCQYETESEKEFVDHIRVHGANRFIVEEKAEKHGQAKETESGSTDEVDFSKGPIRCDRCGYNTSRYDHYLAHLKHHNKVGKNERVYKCTICTYMTVSEYHWKKHLRNHFPRKVYTCSQCSYFSDRKNNYIQHIRIHTGERPYRCSMCPYSSSQKTHLTRHMRTHSGEKPFKCEQCSYVASNQHEVTRHARQVHDGPKPLTCPHCEYKTADRSNFKKHVELHVSPRQFLCPVCEYAASKKCNLQYHIKSRHPDCCGITVDVSKVRLRTKKGEANVTDDDKGGQEKAKKEPTEKNGDKTVKEEKKENLPKEKKPASNAGTGQVTTRSRKTVAEKKEAMKPEKVTEKSDKTKKAKRKADALPLKKDPTLDVDVIAKKKKKTEKKSSKCQDSQKAESKSEAARKQKSCHKKSKKKKSLKSKSGKNNKTDCKNVPDEDPVSEEVPVTQDGEHKVPKDPGNELQLIGAPNKGDNEGVVLKKNLQAQVPQDQEPQVQELQPVQHVTEAMELEVKAQEMPVAEEEIAEASQNEAETELPLIPVASSEDFSVAALEKTRDVIKDTLPDLVQETQTTHTSEVEMVANPDLVQATQPTQVCETERVTTSDPEDDSSTKKLQAETQEGEPPSQLPEKMEPDTKADLASVSPSGVMVTESHEMEEDEGIHSHDGSDISDNISERSDDSGLNGARSVQEETNQKPSQEVAEAEAAKENYTCIFCDRSFNKESVYSKHLNRHLVNVYYLEKATKGQG